MFRKWQKYCNYIKCIIFIMIITTIELWHELKWNCIKITFSSCTIVSFVASLCRNLTNLIMNNFFLINKKKYIFIVCIICLLVKYEWNHKTHECTVEYSKCNIILSLTNTHTKLLNISNKHQKIAKIFT